MAVDSLCNFSVAGVAVTPGIVGIDRLLGGVSAERSDYLVFRGQAIGELPGILLAWCVKKI
jgi:hypothetical protein